MSCAFLQLWFNLPSLIHYLFEVSDEYEVVGLFFTIIDDLEVGFVFLIDVAFSCFHGGINECVVLMDVVIGAIGAAGVGYL
jgi:hypothetical protein